MHLSKGKVVFLSGIESGETGALWRHKRILDLMPLIKLVLLVHVGETIGKGSIFVTLIIFTSDVTLID